MLILIKFWKELIIIILFISCFVCYFIGKKTTPIIPTEIRIEKIIDEVATKRAVEEELIKLSSEFKQIKIKDTIKLPNGTFKTHEITKIEKNDTKTDDTSKKEFDEQTINTVEKTTFKLNANDWSLNLATGFKKNNIRDINNLNDINWCASAELKKNWTDNFSSFFQTEYEDLKSNNSPISFKIGIIKFEARF